MNQRINIVCSLLVLFCMDKVISLKMDRSDEIGELYESIRSMQMRIVIDTQRLKQDAVEKGICRPN